jgi:hypothetical protein
LGSSNQCAGASSACINPVARLNLLLREHESVQLVDTVTYSVTTDNNIAQLYISWREDNLNYFWCFIQRVGAFPLSSPDHFKGFRKQVRSILDWGKDKRLKQIGNALDIILEKNRKRQQSLGRCRMRKKGKDSIELFKRARRGK